MNRNRVMNKVGLPFAVCFSVMALLLLLDGCGVTGLRRVPHVDPGRTFQEVQVLPNYGGNADCNRETCVVLFTDANASLYLPRVGRGGPGSPADYNLADLHPYEAGDGSILYAPLGWNPVEYRTSSGETRIQFSSEVGRGMSQPGRLGF